jgi:membrane-bound lytic murein transglycosylase A
MLFARRSLPAAAVSVIVLALSACGTQQPAPQAAPAPPVPVQPAPPPPLPVPVPPLPVPVPVPAPAPAPPAKTAFVPVPFSALPGWAADDLRAAWPAFAASCRVLAKRADWQAACGASATVDTADSSAIRQYFETWFQPNQVIAPDGADTGLVTGYYEPLLYGSRKKAGAYQTPLYKVPDDLLTIDLGSVYPDLKGKRYRGRLQGRRVIPYNSRAEIASADFKGKELLWVNDPVEAFFLEVQGSGRVQLDTGETVRVAYADQNGHPYKAIGRWLIEQGELTPEQASAQGIKAWIAANPARMQELFNANGSYIFFREEKLPDPSVGPKGSLGVALTGGRSAAVDPSQIVLGAPIYLSTTQPASDVPLQRLLMAQDTGGAIKGAIRVDFFFGFGTEAMESAGRMKQRGQVWMLLPKAAP